MPPAATTARLGVAFSHALTFPCSLCVYPCVVLCCVVLCCVVLCCVVSPIGGMAGGPHPHCSHRPCRPLLPWPHAAGWLTARTPADCHAPALRALHVRHRPRHVCSKRRLWRWCHHWVVDACCSAQLWTQRVPQCVVRPRCPPRCPRCCDSPRCNSPRPCVPNPWRASVCALVPCSVGFGGPLSWWRTPHGPLWAWECKHHLHCPQRHVPAWCVFVVLQHFCVWQKSMTRSLVTSSSICVWWLVLLWLPSYGGASSLFSRSRHLCHGACWLRRDL
jgi:hypothetical protein